MNQVRTTLVAVALLLQASAAAAQQSTGDATLAAEDLFQRGKDAMRAGDYGAACPLLAESYRIDAAGGTLQNLAVCYESVGQTASAYTRFIELRTMSAKANPPRQDRISLADAHIAALQSRLSRVVIDVEASTRNAHPKLTIDSIEYGEASWKAGVLVDPGKHEIVVTAVDKLPFRTAFEVRGEHQTQRLAVGALAAAPIAPPPPPPPSSHRGSGLRQAGYVSLGVGSAVLVAGAVFGGLAIHSAASAQDVCQGSCQTQDQADRANGKRDDARTFANVSNVLLPVGAVAAVVGGVLIWRGFAKDRTSASMQVAPTFGGLVARGTF